MQNNPEYKSIYFLSTLYMSLMALSAILGNKLISTPYGVLAGASLISPFWFIVGDIITEVYGFKIIKKLFWSVIICQFIFAAACWLIIKLPSPANWEGQNGYNLVCGHLLKMFIFQFIGITIAWNINIRLLTKWKILLRGKYFWLRSIGSSGLGLIIFSFISVSASIYNMYPFNEVVSIVSWSALLKIIFIILLAVPSNLIVFLLKVYEGIDINELRPQVNYNPFKP